MTQLCKYLPNLPQCRDNTPTPTASPSPSATPLVTASPTGTPYASPTATASAEPTSTPSATASAVPTSEPRTDLTDGRSDGRTGSLACLRPEDNCNTAVAKTTVQETKTLPATGQTDAISGALIFVAILLFAIGVKLVVSSYKQERMIK